MNELETLILTQVANEMPVTSADEAFRSYRPKDVRTAMLELGKLGWFEATLVPSLQGNRVDVGLVDLKTIRQFSLARET